MHLKERCRHGCVLNTDGEECEHTESWEYADAQVDWLMEQIPILLGRIKKLERRLDCTDSGRTLEEALREGL